ncbi:MAG: VWA domain-containing protein [Candidatus Eremiobacteraeota bacterium]|nr:VWA domain-containing protein [Candidatus Eremiobacteraeota bacterium]
MLDFRCYHQGQVIGDNDCLRVLLVASSPPQRRQRGLGLALSLVLDRSSSMTVPMMEAAKKAAVAVVRQTSEEDVLMVSTFSDDFENLGGPGPCVEFHRRDLTRAIKKIEARGGTRFSPVLEFSARKLKTYENRLRRVLFLTDGKNTESRPMLERAVERCLECQVEIHSWGFGSDWDADELNYLSLQTGGKAGAILAPAQAVSAFQESFDTMVNTAAAEVHFHLDLAPGVQVRSMRLTHPHVMEMRRTQKGPHLSAPLGSFGYDTQRVCLLEVSGEVGPCLDAWLEYRDSEGVAHKSPVESIQVAKPQGSIDEHPYIRHYLEQLDLVDLATAARRAIVEDENQAQDLLVEALDRSNALGNANLARTLEELLSRQQDGSYRIRTGDTRGTRQTLGLQLNQTVPHA